MMRIARSLGLLLFAAVLLSMPAASHAQIGVGISVRIGPPALPVYVQPVCPGPGYIWTPGYWAHGDDDYYWVPGTWVLAPEPGFLWTPGYWGFNEGVYVWHAGYWGPHVGFYGGINYGFGYTGVGFWGGEWRGREFVYNRSVTNINTTIIHNTYNRTVVVNNVTNVSYNGGPHGIQARASERERIAEHDRHIEARHEQMEHEHAARSDRRQWASENHGRPAVAASGRPGEFHRDVVAARVDNRADHRADRPSNVAHDNRNAGRNDRPASAGNRENNSRPNSAPANNMRQARESRPVPQGEARGNPHVDHTATQHSDAPQGEARGNPHVAPAQHSNPAPHGNAAHESAPRSNSKPEHGKPEKP
jgi:hypothetical protein